MTTKEVAKLCLTLAEQLGVTNKSDLALNIVSLCLFGDMPLETASREVMDERVGTEQPHRPTKPDTRAALKKRVSAMKKAAKESDRDKTPPKLLCRANTKCHCSVCAKAVYSVLSDIHDGLPATDFAAKFLPVGHGKLLPVPMRLRAIDNCVMTDCPVCGGDMTLVLWGKRPDRDFDDGGVGSAKGGEV